MIRSLLVIFGVLVLAHHAVAEEPRPLGKNCDLDSPPPASGEDAHMYGGAFKIYPRAKNIDGNYNGCQVVWRSSGENIDNWSLYVVFELKGEELVQAWMPIESEYSHSKCKYENGQLISGNTNHCFKPERVPVKSMASGCLSGLLAASYDRKAQLPKGCLSYE